MITFRHILNKLHDGEICDIDVVTYDRKRRTGGQVKSYRCILAQKASGPAHRPSTSVETQSIASRNREKDSRDRVVERSRGSVPERSRDRVVERSRDPNHKKWYTRNVQLVTNDDFLTPIIKKIHIPLIIRFDGQNVVP